MVLVAQHISMVLRRVVLEQTDEVQVKGKEIHQITNAVHAAVVTVTPAAGGRIATPVPGASREVIVVVVIDPPAPRLILASLVAVPEVDDAVAVPVRRDFIGHHDDGRTAPQLTIGDVGHSDLQVHTHRNCRVAVNRAQHPGRNGRITVLPGSVRLRVLPLLV